VDHIDGHGWDNRRGNRRICTPAQNGCNRGKWNRSTSSQYKGVTRQPATGRYFARIGHKRRRIHLGTFDIEIEAARAYDRLAVECFGEFAGLNFPEEWPPERRREAYAKKETIRAAQKAKAQRTKMRRRTKEGR
jgi:hypothetical protein